MQDIATIRSLLDSRGLRPKHRFGQNFLHDPGAMRTILQAAGVHPGETILEVGPGTGTLTETLLEAGARVVACELDRDMAAIVRDRLGARITLVEGDCLQDKHTLNPVLLQALGGPFRMVANLPYAAATPLIASLLENHPECGGMVVTIQREVADRLTARPDTSEIGPLTITAQLLATVRDQGLHLFHVVGGGNYYQECPGYRRAVSLAGLSSPDPKAPVDPSLEELRRFRARHVFVGEHNRGDVDAGFAGLDFPAAARPLGEEGIAENAQQLTALCLDAGVNHLIYAGFAINWCLLMSPGGMVDMSRRGVICSAFRQAVTAVENKESARTEAHKEEALWRVALAFGFVFDVDNFITVISSQ